MADSVPVRCPTCRRENAFTPPTFPCACGAPLTLPVLRGGVPVEILHRTWQASWVEVRCEVCGRQDEWPAAGVRLRLRHGRPGPRRPGAHSATAELPVPRAAPTARTARAEARRATRHAALREPSRGPRSARSRSVRPATA